MGSKHGALALAALTMCCDAGAVEPVTEHTLTLTQGESSPPATIEDMAWLSGHWQGSALGGKVEEIWSPAEAGGMMGMYRLVRNGKPLFYEILTISEENGSLLLRLKHFHPDLKGWEEKNDTVDFPFVGKRGGVIHFSGMAFHPNGNELVLYLAIDGEDGSVREERFVYTRVPAR